MPFWTPKERLRWAFAVLRDPRLNSTAKVVAVLCEGYVNPDGQFWISKRTIGRQLHISEKSAQRSLKCIAGSDYMRIKKRTGTTPIYTIQFPQAKNDLRVGHANQSSQDNVVPLTLYKPETKPSRSSSPRSVNRFPDPEISDCLENTAAVTEIADYAKRKELGRHEVALAERLGPSGYDILASLPWPKLMYLLLKTSNGTTSENDLSRARDNWLKKMTDPGGA